MFHTSENGYPLSYIFVFFISYGFLGDESKSVTRFKLQSNHKELDQKLKNVQNFHLENYLRKVTLDRILILSLEVVEY